MDAAAGTLSGRSKGLKAFIIGVFIAVSIFDLFFVYAALKVGSDEGDRMGIE